MLGTLQEPREALAAQLRAVSPSVALAVTEEFLDRHPDWRTRYGARAVTHGVQDAQFHLAFLASAVESNDRAAFATYARWTARVLAARNIGTHFLAENLTQLRDALAGRIGQESSSILAPFFAAANEALSDPAESPGVVLNLTAGVFLQALLSGQRAAAVQVAREALREGLSLPALYLDVFQPAMYEVGARWEANRLTVAQEHVATAITQYVMAQIYEPPRAEPTRGSLVLTGVEGEYHNIGAVMVGDLLESTGWKVRFLGTNLPASSILSSIRDEAPSHVGISATMLFNVAAVRELIAAIRAEFDHRVRIVVGGAAFRANPELWRQVSADGFATDLGGVSALLEERT